MEFGLRAKTIELLKAYAGVEKVGYHHFDCDLLKCKLVGSENTLVCLSHHEAVEAMQQERIIKSQF